MRRSQRDSSAPLSFTSTKIALKTSDRADCATGKRVERSALSFIDVVAIACVAEMVPALVQRPAGEIEKVSEFRIRSPSETFRDIGWRRGDRRSNLIAEVSIGLDVWSFGEFVDGEFQLVRKLPAVEILKAADARHADLECMKRSVQQTLAKVEKRPEAIADLAMLKARS